jgi:PIN domain nuclease of toxin-antitoxin system
LRLLLDTHVWVWSQGASTRLGGRARRAIESAGNELWLSPMSLWEAVLLADAGRLRLGPDPIAWIRYALEDLPVREAPLTHEIALASRRIEHSNDDPADRFLIATAKVLGLTLVTADERLLVSREVDSLSAR